MNFKNAQEAFESTYKYIHENGLDRLDSLAIFNYGFTIENPLDRDINTDIRKFNKEYAEAEWQWYLTGDRTVDGLGEIYGTVPAIWQRMANQYNEVNSNYGWQWMRNHQLDKVIDKLKSNKNTRQATVSIYDGKEIDDYNKDTPCTYAITFTIVDGNLDMSVLMRSNDLWFGFCNDQYCFSKLQELVANRLEIKVGKYYHHATNMHLYNKHLNLKIWN
jgi:thymidylate synthase